MDNLSKEIVAPYHRNSLDTLNFSLGILGAFLGAAVGYYAFYWLASQGFYAIALPGVFVGLISRFSRFSFRKNLMSVNLFCAIFSIGVGLYIEWKFFPFVKDTSLYYFITHLQLLKPLTWILISIGAVLAFHFSKIQNEPPMGTAQPPQPADSSAKKNTPE